jgi:hypothetical protein
MLPALMAMVVGLSAMAAAAPQQPAAAAAAVAPPAERGPTGSKIWIGREAEFEEYLRTAELVRKEEVNIGVTRPTRWFFQQGGLCASVVFKPLEPGKQSGFFESYKSEIAAWVLDQLVGLDMVPPTVERKVKGRFGSAQLWVEKVKWLKDRDTDQATDKAAWNRQVYRQRVWDNLTGNIDRNQGNLLVDEAWNLILIDHSRAFTMVQQMPFPMTRIDRPFYEKLKGLDRKDIEKRLGRLLPDGPRPLIGRRDKIVEHFEKLIKQYGEAGVLVP